MCEEETNDKWTVIEGQVNEWISSFYTLTTMITFVRECIDVYLKRYYLYCFERWTCTRQEEREREKVKMVQFSSSSSVASRITITLNRTKERERKSEESIQENNNHKFFCLVYTRIQTKTTSTYVFSIDRFLPIQKKETCLFRTHRSLPPSHYLKDRWQ